MQWILSSEEMKYCDSATINHFGVPSLVLMEKAAERIAGEIRRRFPKTQPVLVVCGSGNNGGDGFAVGRILHIQGYPVSFYFAGKEEKCSPETALQIKIARQYGIPFRNALPAEDQGDGYAVIVDALFGNGLSRDLGEPYAGIIRTLNRLPGYKIAVDIPSGISADSGAVMGCAFRADLTVAVAYKKLGHVLFPGADYCGEISVKDIGISKQSWLGRQPSVLELERDDLERLPKRSPHSNKGTFGKVFVAAGSKGMAGAAYFSAKAAYRCGCGLVKIFTAEENRTILQQSIPEAVLATYREEDVEGNRLVEHLNGHLAWADAVAAGPGLGQGEASRLILNTILNHCSVPLILDADALNLIAKDPSVLKQTHCPVAVTPHVGEMARLSGRTVADVLKDLLGTARKFAAEYGVVCLLKDAHSVCALPDGTAYLVTSGNSGMATAGSGDVLTGMAAALAGMGLKLEEALPYGAYLHGLAGSYAAGQKGEASLMASDILDHIYEIWKRKQG